MLKFDTSLAGRLTDWVTTFEDVLHIVSGPFLAAGALIATSFIFTDGAIDRSGAVGTTLLIFWSVTQAIGLDFQVLSLGYKSINAARSGKWGVCAFLILLAGVLGFVGVQTHAVFGFVSSNSASIPAAMHAMGIDQRILLWERAGLSFLLTFIAGAMRPDRKVQMVDDQVQEASAIVAIQEQLADLDRKIEALPAPAPAVQALPAVAESKLQEVLSKIETLTIQVNATLSNEYPVLSNQVSNLDTDPLVLVVPDTQKLEDEQSPVQPLDSQLDTLDSKVDRLDSQVSSAIQSTREAAVRAVLAKEPGLSANAIARKVGCSTTTASTWKKKIEAESEAVG